MPDQITLEIVRPDRSLLTEQVDEVVIPAHDGYLGVLPEHAPLISLLGTGVLSYKIAGKEQFLMISGGVLEVLPDRVRVLADEADWAREVDINKAEEARRRANDLLSSHKLETEMEEARAALAKAEAQIEAAKRLAAAR